MIKYTTIYEHGEYKVKQIRWKPEEHYNSTSVYSSFDDALDYVYDINKLIKLVKGND